MSSDKSKQINAVLDAQHVLETWFKDDDSGRMDLPQPKRWFMGGQKLDEYLKATYSTTLTAAANGELDHWLDDAQSALAFIVLLDQFNRNMNRGTAKAFALDAKALAVSRQALDLNYTSQYTLTQKMFCYMPFEHDESYESQKTAVELFQQLKNDAPDEYKEFADGALASAIEHQEIVEQFGRYPHRNKTLGRANTDKEEQWLAGDHKSFGQ
ncbi:MAG: DUF924 family protein [Granulosicoccus sp.]